MKKLALALVVLISLFGSGLTASAQEQREFQFNTPDVRDDYCGVEVSYIYCQCAFHDIAASCTAADMDQADANRYVRSGFRDWVAGLIESFGANCIRNDGQWNRSRRTCTYPAPDEPQTIEERYGLPDYTGKPAEATGGAVGKVVSTEECKVFVFMTAFQSWRGPVQPGQPIYGDDVVVTRGPEHCAGYARITFFDAAGERTIRFGESTLLELYPPDDVSAETFTGELKQGAVRIWEELTEEEEWQSPFNIRTPTLAPGVRGTELFIAHDESTGVSEVLVVDGEVELAYAGSTETVILGANEGATHDGETLETKEFTDDEWNDALREYGLEGERIALTEEDLTAPTGPRTEFTRAELVGDLSFLDDQFGGGGFPVGAIFMGLLIAAIVAMLGAVILAAPILLLPPESRLKR